MCGIAAIVGWEDLPLRESCVAEMIDLMAHRGPDGSGLHSLPSVTLGHCRLAILDLSSHSKQPIRSPCGRYHLIFNGEIYNYLELRRELQKDGISFQTAGDGEVLLAAYARWGKKALPKLNGMFAFLFYDEKERILFGARDRFGEKPLYFWKSPLGYTAFASEIKGFTPLPGWKAALDHQQGYLYLNWGLTDGTRETLFAGVSQLLGGESFTFSEGKMTIERWYTPEIVPKKGSLASAVEEFSSLFRDSLSLRLRTDVPIGSCLSGGIDSSSIVCSLAALGHRPSTFSACFSLPRIDEKRYMEAVAHKTKGPAHYVYPEKEELFSQLEEILWFQDLPFGSTSIFAQWEVFKRAKNEGIKVMLDGQGADEQLGGYQGSREKVLEEHLRRGNIFRSFANFPHALGLPLFGKWIPKPLRSPLKKVLGKNQESNYWIDFNRLHVDKTNPFHKQEKSPFPEYRKIQLLETSLPMLLRYEDRDSMAHSIEARTPFLDHRLVELSLSLPGEFLVDRGLTKIVLRESCKGVLPKKIYERRTKLGFETPEKEWMQDPKFQKLLSQAVDRSQGIIRPEILRPGPFNFHYFRAICFSLWLQRFQVSV